MATLKDLATSLNLSVMAVSKALRDAPDISAGTKSRVQEEARRQNYVPNRVAQNLRSRRSGLVGVLVPQINDSSYSHLLWGIERQASAVDMQVIIASSLDRAEHEIREVQKMIARQVDALLLVPAVRWRNRLATLELARAGGVPTVLLDAYPAGADAFPQASWVVCDDKRGGQLATEHLLQLGHTEILFLAGPNGSSSSAGRFSGYRQALTAARVAYVDARVFLADQHIESGAAAMTQALSERVSFSAVVAFNDNVAIGAAEALHQQGYRVPEDVSLVGFGDGILAAHHRVPLTTVRVPHGEMGETALRLALDLRQNKPVQPRQLPVEIIVRASTRKRIPNP